MKKKILKTVYNLGGFASFHWANRDKPLILTYHRFSKGKELLKTSAAEFGLHLEYLKKHCNVVPLSAIERSYSTGEKLPRNSVAITIDDGYADAFEVAFPVLNDFGFSATLFAITDFVDGKIWLWTDKMRFLLQKTSKDKFRAEIENYDSIEIDLTDRTQILAAADKVNSILKKLPNEEKETKILEIAKKLDVGLPETPTAEFRALTWEMARKMDTGNLKIESHTVSHPILTNIAQNQLRFELQASKERLESKLDRDIEYFCYPNGAFDENVWKSVQSEGYQCAVTTSFGFADISENKFLLNRMDAQTEISDFAQTVSGFEGFKQKIRRT